MRFSALAFVLLFCAPVAAQEPGKQTDIWDLRIGTPAAALPGDAFGEYACGTDGGPPSTPLAGFGDFARCRPEASGLREVQMRYDDELEYWARAHEHPQLIERYQGTRLFIHPIILSALFDEEGVLRGVRAVTDSRATLRQRLVAYSMAAYIRGWFKEEGWTCTTAPAVEGEEPVDGRLIKEGCEKRLDDSVIRVSARLLRKPGQTFIDPHTNEIRRGYFESTARMERLDPGIAAEVPFPAGG